MTTVDSTIQISIKIAMREILNRKKKNRLHLPASRHKDPNRNINFGDIVVVVRTENVWTSRALSTPLYVHHHSFPLHIVGLSPSGSCCHLLNEHQERNKVLFIREDKELIVKSHYYLEFNCKNYYTCVIIILQIIITLFVKL